MPNGKKDSRRQFVGAGSTILIVSLSSENAMSSEKHRNPATSLAIPGYSGRGIPVQAGSAIKVINVEGTQVGDMFALLQSDPGEFLDTARTRLLTRRLFPEVGQQFYSNRYRPLLTFLADTSPGIHDSLYAACDTGLHEILGAGSNHANCHDNFLSAVRDLNLDLQHVPGPVNLFQSTPVSEDGFLSGKPSPALAGDYVELRVEEDIFFVLTACSVDVGSDINGGKSTALHIDVIAPETDSI
jgi:uncharacterized protein YcgI (DUF1989 family)